MVTVVWVVLTLLGAVLYGVSVYLVSVGSGAEGMRDPATAPVWRLLLAGIRGEVFKESGLEDHRRTAA